MITGSIVLAFIAGALSILSPCVLPILPLVLGTAASDHKLGPLALAGGLSLSFAIIGLFVATIGYSIGLNGDVLRLVAAALIIVIGTVLVVPSLQARLAVASGAMVRIPAKAINKVFISLLSEVGELSLKLIRRCKARG